ncbi:MAG TPA: hypothetical protein VEQ58_14645, partial [Polyangiaceae bacterium]|nr:hypothetical protein [Polyangiaceae bacterium]
VSAVDINGLFVAAAFDCQPDALYVDELELSAPMLATPTLRGVPRATPTTPIAAPAPLWIDYGADGSAHELWASASARSVDEQGASRLGIRRDSVKRTVEGLHG